MTAPTERCPRCDQVRAVENGHPGGCLCESCVSMCWRDWGVECNAIDWRQRALVAEQRADAAEASDAESLRLFRAARDRGEATARALFQMQGGAMDLRARLDAAKTIARDAILLGLATARLHFDEKGAEAFEMYKAKLAALSTPTTPDDPRKQPEPEGVVNLPPAELGAFALRVLAASAFDACDDLFWRTDGKYAPLWISAKCSDCFMWACADSEPITPENIDTFERSMADCDAEGDAMYGVYLFAARVRQQVPMAAFLADLRPATRALFESVAKDPTP